MPKIIGVRFNPGAKIYYFDPTGYSDLVIGERVVVNTSRGPEMGQIVIEPREVDDTEITGQLKPIQRRATAADHISRQRYCAMEPEAREKCCEKARELRLPLKVVSARYSFDGSRLVFTFTAESRVDFRELVRDLAKVFRARIEMRQVGVRDEARHIGGLGHCGCQLCCASWLSELNPVSIKMAKAQDLPLSPAEISGVCGRLLCCLTYENDMYVEAKRRLPKRGTHVETPRGTGRIIGVHALKESVTVRLEDDSVVHFTLQELQDQSPKPDSAVGEPSGRGREPDSPTKRPDEKRTPSRRGPRRDRRKDSGNR